MNRSFLVAIAWIFVGINGFSQIRTAADSALSITRTASTKLNDLVDTRLDVRFDYAKAWMYGKAWITLKPHAYPMDSVTLDAKGMDIRQVSLVRGGALSPLQYHYSGMQLDIRLGKAYRPGEAYTVYIDYISKPNDLKLPGSRAITDAKGLYFINPTGADKDKPTQIWTQGETESNSTWFPTIDKPNQKCTEQITMTVPAKYVTLSNGKLIAQKPNADGTRTDTWKMDLPHSPYLFFMGIGDFAIVRDRYKGKEVNYYVEKEYAPVARRIFGYTPQMIAFYEKILGVPFPWVKYSQMTGRDYVSGAMENTTSTLHTDALQQDARQLSDGNQYENYICHELFHQWFGDLVTCESWSNLTVNESFANFSETIWSEYMHGKDAGDATNYDDMQKYLGDTSNYSKNLVRYHYTDREAVFDAISYMKGGRILNMLRKYLGDTVFYKALHLYLETNKFKNAEAATLRMAFEEASGQDLHWYWDQWYYGSGHPKFTIDYAWDEAAKTQQVFIAQVQGTGKIFRVPMAIDVYEGGGKTRHNVWVEHERDTFTFVLPHKPSLVNVDGDKIVLCEKTDNKSLSDFIAQYKLAGSYLDRREAIEYCAAHATNDSAIAFLKMALNDKFDGLRSDAIEMLPLDSNQKLKEAVTPVLIDIAKKDPARKVQATAIEVLDGFHDAAYLPLFESKMHDSSYSVAGSALTAISHLDSAKGVALAKEAFAHPARGKLLIAGVDVLLKAHDAQYTDKIIEGYGKMPMSQRKVDDLPLFALMMMEEDNTDKVKKAADVIAHTKTQFAPEQRAEFSKIIDDQLLKPISDRKESAGQKEQADYIRTKMGDQ